MTTTDKEPCTVTFRLPKGHQWHTMEYGTPGMAAEGVLALRQCGCSAFIGVSRTSPQAIKRSEPLA